MCQRSVLFEMSAQPLRTCVCRGVLAEMKLLQRSVHLGKGRREEEVGKSERKGEMEEGKKERGRGNKQCMKPFRIKHTA